MQIYFHSRLWSYLPRVPILVEDTVGNVDFASFHTTYPCQLLFEDACVSSSLVSAIVVAMVVYVRVGRRFQNRGELLLGYERVCFGAFKYQHHLAKIA